MSLSRCFGTCVTLSQPVLNETLDGVCVCVGMCVCVAKETPPLHPHTQRDMTHNLSMAME